jgi:hypothetical protein
LVTISRPAIEPAISTLPVKNQLIANVSSVPNVRQLTALSIDLVCVSAPRNKTTRRDSLADDDRTYHADAPCLLAIRIHRWTGPAITGILLQDSGKLFDMTEIIAVR